MTGKYVREADLIYLTDLFDLLEAGGRQCPWCGARLARYKLDSAKVPPHVEQWLYPGLYLSEECEKVFTCGYWKTYLPDGRQYESGNEFSDLANLVRECQE